MSARREGSLVEPMDRKLGDEWTGWSGETESAELDATERATTFLVLGGAILFLLLVLLNTGWYLVKPRIGQFSSLAPGLLERCVEGFSVLILLVVATEVISVARFEKSLLPYLWTERFLLALLPRSVWLGGKFGMSRDRISNSFIKAHNVVLKANADRLNARRLLILLPRCLEKGTRKEVLDRIDPLSAKTVTASGGEEARKAIREHRPSLILAVACERDLISGLRDVAGKIPVLAIPNRRPQGPCKNTQLAIDELDEALRFIAERKETKRVDCVS
ncbi:MAG TPA: DUF116 domain-containing protein [Syntrophorhabdales bacterium]|nr:DUF116 domain-containing protein [Syntrophorhabdales bacterium]